MSSIELRERHVSAAFLDAKFICIAQLEAVTTIMPVMPRPDKNESQQKFKFLKSRKESTTVHTELQAKQEQQFQLPTIQVP